MRTCFKFPYSSLKRDWEDEGRVDEVLFMVDVALYHSNFNGNCIQIRVNRYGFGWQGMKGISVGESVQAIIPLSIPARATTSSSTWLGRVLRSLRLRMGGFLGLSSTSSRGSLGQRSLRIMLPSTTTVASSASVSSSPWKSSMLS